MWLPLSLHHQCFHSSCDFHIPVENPSPISAFMSHDHHLTSSYLDPSATHSPVIPATTLPPSHRQLIASFPHFMKKRSSKRMSSFSIQWSTHLTACLLCTPPSPLFLQINMLPSKLNTSTCQLVLNLAHTIKDITLAVGCYHCLNKPTVQNHLDTINFQFPP